MRFINNDLRFDAFVRIRPPGSTMISAEERLELGGVHFDRAEFLPETPGPTSDGTLDLYSGNNTSRP
jgi:hypothetical protein